MAERRKKSAGKQVANRAMQGFTFHLLSRLFLCLLLQVSVALFIEIQI
jgi:hypothetical protein